MNYINLIIVIFSATGFWKLIEFLLKYRNERKKQSAEILNLQSQAESNIVDNWVQWSQTLEKRVKELEAVAIENKELKKQIDNQRKRIVELENKVGRFEKENEQLHKQIAELSKPLDGE